MTQPAQEMENYNSGCHRLRSTRCPICTAKIATQRQRHARGMMRSSTCRTVYEVRRSSTSSCIVILPCTSLILHVPAHGAHAGKFRWTIKARAAHGARRSKLPWHAAFPRTGTSSRREAPMDPQNGISQDTMFNVKSKGDSRGNVSCSTCSLGNLIKRSSISRLSDIHMSDLLYQQWASGFAKSIARLSLIFSVRWCHCGTKHPTTGSKTFEYT